MDIAVDYPPYWSSLDDYVTMLEFKIETLYDAIKYGDEKHQAWLKEAISAHFKGEPIPPP